MGFILKLVYSGVSGVMGSIKKTFKPDHTGGHISITCDGPTGYRWNLEGRWSRSFRQ